MRVTDLEIIRGLGEHGLGVEASYRHLHALAHVPGVDVHLVELHGPLFPGHREQEASVRHLVPGEREWESIEVHQQLPLNILGVIVKRG